MAAGGLGRYLLRDPSAAAFAIFCAADILPVDAMP